MSRFGAGAEVADQGMDWCATSALRDRNRSGTDWRLGYRILQVYVQQES